MLRFEEGKWRMLVTSLSKTCLCVRNNSFKNAKNKNKEKNDNQFIATATKGKNKRVTVAE